MNSQIRQKYMEEVILYSKLIPSPVGNLIGIGSDKELYFLEFLIDKAKEDVFSRINSKYGYNIKYESNSILEDLEKELMEYFSGKRKAFSIPLKMIGSSFDSKVWRGLLEIPYGNLVSYKDIARNIGNEKAFRAVGNANNRNNIPILIPCHRVVLNNGGLGGYALGLDKKKLLIELEKNNK